MTIPTARFRSTWSSFQKLDEWVAGPVGTIADSVESVETKLNRYGGEQRRILGGRAGERAWIEVRDNGPWVRAEDAGRIVEELSTGEWRERFRLELPVDRTAAMILASRAARG